MQQSPPATNVFVRYHEGAQFEQIQTGEELVQPMTATLKKPYKRPRDGPTLGKALLVGNLGYALATPLALVFYRAALAVGLG